MRSQYNLIKLDRLRKFESVTPVGNLAKLCREYIWTNTEIMDLYSNNSALETVKKRVYEDIRITTKIEGRKWEQLGIIITYHDATNK